MKQFFCLRLQHEDFSRDDLRIYFRASLYRARRVYDSLAYVLPASPYESIWLELASGEVLLYTKERR